MIHCHTQALFSIHKYNEQNREHNRVYKIVKKNILHKFQESNIKSKI